MDDFTRFFSNWANSPSEQSCLLIGESHELSTAGILTRAQNYQTLVHSKREIIILFEGLQCLKTNGLFGFFSFSNTENAYSSQQINNSTQIDRDKKEYTQLMDAGVKIYGLEDKHTDPLDTFKCCKTKDELYNSVKNYAAYLLKENLVVNFYYKGTMETIITPISDLFQDPNESVSSIIEILTRKIAVSDQRLFANEHFSKVIQKVAQEHPTALIIACVGNAHIPMAKKNHQMIEQGMYLRLANAGMHVIACSSSAFTQEYTPLDDLGVIVYDPIPPLPNISQQIDIKRDPP